MRNEVLKYNDHSWIDRLTAYYKNGKANFLTPRELGWMNSKLFLELAPEPNDIDWEFIFVRTDLKIKWRSFSWTLTLCFMLLTFLLIYLL